MSDQNLKVSIVIPAHNEEGNLSRLMDELIPVIEKDPATSNFELVIVDDNSTDKTSMMIDNFAKNDSRIKPIHRVDTPGFGNAVKTGLKNASGDIIIPVMADLSDDPHDIPKLVHKIEEGYDIAYGSRFCKGGYTINYPKKKMLANRLFNNSVRLAFGIRHKDITNAFKAYRREVLDAIGIDNIEANGFDMTVEIPLKAHILGFKSAEVPVSWRDREAGEAKLKLSENGHRYGSRLIKMFFLGNAVALGDLFGSVVKGSPVRLILATLLGLLLLSGIFSIAGFSEIFEILQNISLEYVGVAFIMIFATFVFRTWRWSVLLRTAGYRVHRDTAFKCIMFGWLLNYLLPARVGDVARGMALKATESTPLGVSISTIVIERAMDLLIMGMILLVTIAFFARDTPLLSIGAGAMVIAFGLIVALAFIYKFENKFISLLGSRFDSIQESFALLKEGLYGISKNPEAILLCLILSVPIWLFEVSSLYFAAKSLHFDLEPQLAVLSGITAFISQAIPNTPAGIGVHEGAVAGVLSIFGIDVSLGTSIALVDHFARASVTYVVGMISAVHLGFESRAYFAKNDAERKNITNE